MSEPQVFIPVIVVSAKQVKQYRSNCNKHDQKTKNFGSAEGVELVYV